MKHKITLFTAFLTFFMITYLSGSGIPVSIVASTIGSILLYVIPVLNKKRKNKIINRSYDMDLPDLLIHISMFTEAGVTLWDAIDRALSVGNQDKALYRDLLKALENTRKGIFKDNLTALEDIAACRKSAALSNFCAVIAQNIRKGSGELCTLFASQAQLYRAERYQAAGKIAEEAATLLLIPSTIVLAALILMLLAPAVIGIFGGL